jgi:hypothetical protein
VPIFDEPEVAVLETDDLGAALADEALGDGPYDRVESGAIAAACQ